MDNPFFNPRNYWLLFAAACVLADLFVKGNMYLALVGVGAFVAAFLAANANSFLFQIGAFVFVTGVLGLYAHGWLWRRRQETFRQVRESLEWLARQDAVVVEKIRGVWASGKVAVGGAVLRAHSLREIPEGTRVRVVGTGFKGVDVVPVEHEGKRGVG